MDSEPSDTSGADRGDGYACEHEAEQRYRTAEERDRLADERDRAADERERLADERERLADDRERALDDRELRLSELERRLDHRAQQMGVMTAGSRQRSYEAVERSRALLDATAAGLDRSRAALRRADASDDRDQKSVDRELRASERQAATGGGEQPPGADLSDEADEGVLGEGTSPDEAVARLRAQFLAAAVGLADAEDEVARRHDCLMAEDPDAADDHRRQAERSREVAQCARDVVQRLCGET
ncbi:hypothetical protein [Streptomyces violens]|uniref:hypothetical protein n=1 Tax=Streptomyces violens TaxID=66377 RepID=UPI00068CD352|nr:hypothetical protein [Streptomyces violens]